MLTANLIIVFVQSTFDESLASAENIKEKVTVPTLPRDHELVKLVNHNLFKFPFSL